jgi:hypothetical protein
MIVGARLLVVPLTALALAPLANAAPPTLLGVNHVQRHPQATWTLAPESEAAVVEVATSPQTGSDGYFFTENVEAFDTLEASQTTWLSSSRLKPGNYYVHVASYTPSCFTCPIREWSEVASLLVKNQKPRISRLRVRYRGRYAIEGLATFRYCDDIGDYATGFILERLWLRNIFRSSARHSEYFSVGRGGCSTRTVTWYPPSRVFGVGWHSVRLQVRDDDGGLSNKLTRTWFVSD